MPKTMSISEVGGWVGWVCCGSSAAFHLLELDQLLFFKPIESNFAIKLCKVSSVTQFSNSLSSLEESGGMQGPNESE